MFAPIASPRPTIESRAYVIEASCCRFDASNRSASSPLASTPAMIFSYSARTSDGVWPGATTSITCTTDARRSSSGVGL